jgi:hypothetical protein
VWRTDTYWFDVAVVVFLLMLGQLFFGRFSEYQQRWRRLLKSLVGIVLIVGTAALFGRAWMWVLIAAIGVALIVVHGWWLPRNGVNGWTAEPRERYYELLGLDAHGKRRERTR